MTIERVINGTIYEFPDGTPPATIKRFEASKSAPATGSYTNTGAAPAAAPVAQRPTPGVKPFASGVLGHGLQGLSMGFSDEAIAKARQMMGHGKYEDLVRAEREGLRKYGEEHPVIAGTSEIAGGLVPAVFTGGLGAFTNIARTAPRLASVIGGKSPSVLRMMGYGAGSGAVTAAGTTEKPLNELPSEMAMGAGAGTVAAGTLGLGGKYIAAPAFKYLKNVMGFGDSNKMADLAIVKALQKDGLTPEQAIAKINAMQRGEITIADLGENTAALLRKVTAAPGETRNAAKLNLAGREMERVPRVSEDMRQLMSGSRDFYTDIQDLMKKRADDAQHLYEAAYSAGPAFNANTAPNLNALRGLPSFKEAMKVGQKRMADLGMDIADPKNTLRALHETKLALDDMIETKVRAGEGNQARTLIDMRDRMLKDMEKASPEYGIARAAYAGDSEMLTAMKEGTKIYGMPELDMRKLIKRFEDSPSEMDAWRAGVSQAMLEKLRAAGPSSDPLKSLLGKDSEAKLRRAFKDDDAFDQFKTRMLEESRMLQTEKAGFRKTAQDADLDGPAGAVGALSTLATGNPVAALQQGMSAAMPRVMGVNPNMAKATSEKLLAPISEMQPVMDSIFKSLQAEERALRNQSGVANIAGTATGALAGARPIKDQQMPPGQAPSPTPRIELSNMAPGQPD